MTAIHHNTMISGWALPSASIVLPSRPPIRTIDYNTVADEESQAAHHNVMWLEDVYAHVAAGKKRKAIAVLFREMDELFSKSEFELCNSILASTLDLKRLNVSLWVAVLSITLPASSKLKASRPALVERIRRRLQDEVPERAERLLKGLVPEE